ncbi:MAG: hypothetical protein A2Z97_08060 [Bdellovibrionales bacterium GWB1_52_6]|nr:MAG: hypothetical protein A2Z97_08060 [Bdellovibrionales bacterium GWB1_52_6]OFZ03801.1 MAG: hypothetical protein A2X97_15495 [Bdellovibrionales bacterium GWA1_52_35]HCM40213.1 aminoacetone oxidase family FAD-binding enzyme [Bdellovibrionales bacterium]
MNYDVIILGAGASGLMCAREAGARRRSVLVLDHAAQIGNKILISGGGRCNFTNRDVTAAQYVSQNPHFAKSALSRYSSAQFIALVQDRGIAFEERKHGRLFCLGSAQELVQMLKSHCEAVGVQFSLNTIIQSISRAETGPGFSVSTDQAFLTCESLCVATGGLSIPKIGATGFGYEVARKFGLKIVDTAPALDGFALAGQDRESQALRELAGASLDCSISCNGVRFSEALLFTHQGLSGPVSLQASLYWNPGDPIRIHFVPSGQALYEWFISKKSQGNRSLVRNLLGEHLPSRLADRLCDFHFSSALPLPQVSEKGLEEFCSKIADYLVIPSGTIGYSKAEVTRGGVDTDELSSKTMEAKRVPGLYFIGEVVDVTGWLGGYNLQWAWASGWAAGQVV